MSSIKRKSIKKPEPKAGQGQPPVYPMYQFPSQFVPNYMAQQHGGGMQPMHPAPFAMQAPNGGAFFMSQPCLMPPASSTGQGQNRASTSRRKPWAKDKQNESDDNDDNDDEDDDFAPPKPKKRLSLGSKGSESSNRRSDGNSAAGHIALRKVQSLPPKYMGRPIVSHENDKDCVSCGVYLGEIILVPCGHSAFCTKCVNKLHDKSNALKRLQICPAQNCLSSISGWARMHNIMA